LRSLPSWPQLQRGGSLSFADYLQDRWEHLLDLGIDHALVVIEAILVASLIGVALGLLTYRTDRARELVLAVVGIFLTIPSIALFGLFIRAPDPFGLSRTSVVTALVMYSLLPIVRNTIVGLREVDPAIVESAEGMGMGRLTRLFRIELPLAWPVIITGVRVSTVIIVGIAAIGAYIRGPGLGNDIFTGIARISSPSAPNLVLGGILGVIVIAILFDLFYVLLNRLTTSRGLR
jgi:osmoprotectant transport system permease protein